MSTELEWKWLVERELSLDALVELAGRHDLGTIDHGVRTQVDAYVDGPLGEIAQRGGGLRLRRVGTHGNLCSSIRGSSILCYKGPARLVGQAMERVELEEAWPHIDLPEHTSAVPDRVRSALGEHALARTVELRTQRAWTQLENAASGARAELVSDSVSVRGADGAERGRFAEIELEVLAGEVAQFVEFADAIHGLAGVQASTVSKLQRALRILSGE